MIHCDIRYFDTLASTMDVARDMALSGAEEGTIVQAGEQTAGRGRRGNGWTSPKGNLYQTIILRPHVPIDSWGQLSFVISVALAEAVEQLSNQCATLKWPNDVLIQNKKMAGILIEAGQGFALVGTGVNIETCPDDRSKLHDVCDMSVNDFRDIFFQKIAVCYSQWQDNGFAPIRDLWMARAYRLGQQIQARLPHAVYEGVFDDLDQNGILLLREKNGSVRRINSGEIIYHASGH